MKESILLILDRSLHASLWVFLVTFLVSLVFIAYRLRARRVGLAEYFRDEFDERYRGASLEIGPREMFLSYRPRMALQALLISGGLSAVCFVILAFTPLTFFDNFATQDLSNTAPLQLTSIHYERTTQGFSLEGEVWNRSDHPIAELRAVVEIWKSDRDLLDESSTRVRPDPLTSGSAGTFTMDYFQNSPFLHGYRIRFESGSDRLPHLKGFGTE